MRVVVALGGNALLERGERPDAATQQQHVRSAVEALAPLCREHELIITHGNGPQVGVLALESDGDRALSQGYPLDVIGAETQGMIGYWLLQALENAVPERQFVSLVCQTVVSEDDDAFSRPSKFVGQVYSRAEAGRLASERGWTIRQDGSAWRRVVASPLPCGIVELPVIEGLVAKAVIPICAGGGGIPVVRETDGRLRGIEAVVDKDRTAALLAEELHAGALLLLTDVAVVETGYGTADARPIRRMAAAKMRDITFPAGSMGPKVDAACEYVERTGGVAAIGRLTDAVALLAGEAGTLIEGPAKPPGWSSPL